MREQGVDIDLLDVASAGDSSSRDFDFDFDVVVVGGSLHRGKHQPEIIEWAKSWHRSLAALPGAFFSVSLAAADQSDEARGDAQRCIDEFCEQTGWTPARTEPIAGCLEYREYDVFTRQLMRLLMRRWGRPTDASQDYDYTDWDGVDRLGRECAALARDPSARDVVARRPQ